MLWIVFLALGICRRMGFLGFNGVFLEGSCSGVCLLPSWCLDLLLTALLVRSSLPGLWYALRPCLSWPVSSCSVPVWIWYSSLLHFRAAASLWYPCNSVSRTRLSSSIQFLSSSIILVCCWFVALLLNNPLRVCSHLVLSSPSFSLSISILSLSLCYSKESLLFWMAQSKSSAVITSPFCCSTRRRLDNFNNQSPLLFLSDKLMIS